MSKPRIVTETIASLVQVGAPVTIQMWSDRCAATIVGHSPSRKTVHVQRDIAHLIEGNPYADNARYEFERNPDAEVLTFTLRSTDGDRALYVEKGQPVVRGCTRLILGVRKKWTDPAF